MQAPIVRTQRVFLALWPDDGVREQLAADANQWAAIPQLALISGKAHPGSGVTETPGLS